MAPSTVSNWYGDISSSPRAVVDVTSVAEIVAIVKDIEQYPSPVRAVGSNHSTTACGVAEGGTVIGMRKMNRILHIGHDTVTVQAGALYIDVNQTLRDHGLQFYVNLELGNLTLGSACCGQTKDASMPGEFGQVASYAIGMKMVLPNGDLLEIDESDPELLQVCRSSFGLFGIIYETTFRVRRLAALEVHHERFSLDQFADELSALRARNESMMLYIDPFRDNITIEFRKYHELECQRLSAWQWKLRNYVWSQMAPLYAYNVTRLVPWSRASAVLIDAYDELLSIALTKVIKGEATSPQAQQIRYPNVSTNSRYTFSIWTFPEDRYVDCLRSYYQLTHDHYERTGYRVNLLSVGYRVEQDQSSLFSYSYDGPVITFDPVATGGLGWDTFLREYNAMCSDLGGTPLFNQTDLLTRSQAIRAFGDRIDAFERYRQHFDPENRLLNPFFASLITPTEVPVDQ